jgi:hypothetical protein
MQISPPSSLELRFTTTLIISLILAFLVTIWPLFDLLFLDDEDYEKAENTRKIESYERV